MKKKIIISFLTLFLLFVTGILTTLYIINKTTANLDALLTLHKVEIIRQELVINVQTVQSNLYTTGTQFGKELDTIVDNVLRLGDRVDSCTECHHEFAVEQGLQNLQHLTRQYKDALSYFITSTADQQRIERLQTVAADIGDAIIVRSQEMALNANEVLRRKTVIALDKVRKSKRILAVTMTFALFIVCGIAVYLINSISRPVSELLMATRRIRGGELGYTSPYRGRDEFRELIESFNDMSLILAENNRKIVAHMARNQTILQTSTDGFVLFDEEGHIVDTNPALSNMSGYTREELREMRFTDFDLLKPKIEYDNIQGRIKKAGSLLFEADQITKDGGRIPVEISASFADMEGSGNFFCFIRDISERKKMAEELLKGQKLESIGVLAGGIAHDFNNLLTGIMGYIDLSLKTLVNDDKIYKWLESAKKASSRAQGLTQQLLTFSKGGEPVKQLVTVRELVEESTTFVLSGSNVKCEFIAADDLWMVDADKGQIGQVIQNITLNGAQSMPDGGVITIRAENALVEEGSIVPLEAGEYVKLSFVDRGIGIAGKDLEKIFDPYFSTKHAGSGLGLTICHSIVSKHNGHISVSSDLGVGTSFTVYLPARKKDNRIIDSEQKNVEMRGEGKVLIMDDEEQIRGIVGEMLTHLGYEPDFAVNGGEAISMYQAAMEKNTPYDAVIMDLTIPGGMGGKEAVAKLLEIDPGAKAVVSSGYSNDPVMAGFSKYGFKGVVSKPFDTVELSRVLHRVVMTQVDM